MSTSPGFTPEQRRRNHRTFAVAAAAIILIVSCLLGWARAGAPLPHLGGHPQAGTTWMPYNPSASTSQHPSSAPNASATAPVTKLPPTSKPSSANPSSADATSSSPGATASPQTTAPPPATGTPPLADHISWRPECPIGGYHFCVTFPHPTDQINDGYGQIPLSSATSRSHSRMSFFTKIWIGPDGHYCTSAHDRRCQGPRRGEETFFVDVIKDSKYANSPWRAITALNGGVARHPNFTHFKDRLAVNFCDHVTGHPGMTLWHNGWVYYLGTYASDELPDTVVEANFNRFRDSFQPT